MPGQGGDGTRSTARRRAALAILPAALGAASCRQILGIEPTPAPCADPLLIDDLEDDNATICASQGRYGDWYTEGDGTSSDLSPAPSAPFTPSRIPGGRGPSRFAARFQGSGFTDSGAVMGFSLSSMGAGNVTYNASATGGIRFWMKNDVPVTVELLTLNTVLPAHGGRCVDSASQRNCGSHFSYRIDTTSSEWVQYSVPYAALAQLQLGGTAVFNTSELLSIQFGADPGAPFDVWIDDVSFYGCSTSDCVPTCTDPARPLACPARGRYPAACFAQGMDCALIGAWCADPMLIDDLEDSDGRVCATDGRNGVWGVSSDGTSTDLVPAVGAPVAPSPIPGGRGPSRYAAHMAGSGFTGWGAMLYATLRDGGGAYDASSADGIRFLMKSNTPVTLMISLSATMPASGDGDCAAQPCDQDFQLALPATGADSWVEYKVPFNALLLNPVLDSTGELHLGHEPWDPTRLGAVKLWVQDAAPSFDVWIDDLGFESCTGSDCVVTCADPSLPVACARNDVKYPSCWPAGTDCSVSGDLVDSVAVWGSGQEAWAVGNSLFEGVGSLIHWDGSAWRADDPGPDLPLWGVGGTAANNVWVTSDDGTVTRWNESTWTVATNAIATSLRGVWMSDPANAWAIAYPSTVLRWDGKRTLSPVTTARERLNCVWGLSSSDVWAVGDAGTILHFVGNTWTETQFGTNALSAIWGTASDNVWAVGDAGTILHFDGRDWKARGSPTTHDLAGVWGSAENDVWAVGTAGKILHFDGQYWWTFSSPTDLSLRAIWGSDGSHVWAVGSHNIILGFDGNEWSLFPILWTTY
jgi:hypothetical protein